MASLLTWFHHFHLRTETYNFWTFVLLAVQAGFFVAQTCVFAATAYWAWRYTEETVLLRKEAQKQASSSYKQFDLSRRAFEQQEADKIRASQPYFDFTTSTSYGEARRRAPNQFNVQFTIRIAAIYALQVKVAPTVVHLDQHFYGFLKEGSTAYIDFLLPEGPLPETWEFKCDYFTLLNRPHTQTFMVTLDSIQSVEHNARVAEFNKPA